MIYEHQFYQFNISPNKSLMNKQLDEKDEFMKYC